MVNQDKMYLLVDLDNSLLKIDLFKETLGKSILKQPWVFLRTVKLALGNRAKAKIYISKKYNIEPLTLPYNKNVIDIINNYRERGYKIVLATGASIHYADPISNHLKLFDKVIATNESRNMTGINKLNAIKKEINDDCIYIGDSKKDIPIWLHCKKAILVGGKNIIKKLKKSDVEIIDIVKKEKSSFNILLKQLRVYQWSKNLLLFVPALTSHQLLSSGVFMNAIQGFFAFSLLASSIYVLNDIVDIDYDRKHPKKKNRPIAAGDLSIFRAYVYMLFCFLAGIFLSFNLGTTFLMVAGVYIALNLLYSFYLKKVIILDVIILMSFYALRLIAGHVPDAVPLSPWLLSFSIFLFFSLGLLKRYVDTIVIRENNATLLSGRGYSINDDHMLISLGVGSGLISGLVLILYTGSEQVMQFYKTPMVLVGISPIMLYWISRMWLLASRGIIESDPVFFAVKDKVTYAVAIMFLTIMFLAKYISV
jgi:4-hydroxybenzoate polyprenyltransferase